MNNHDFEKIHSLTNLVLGFKQKGNAFKGVRVRRKFRKVVNAAKSLSATFEHFTPWAFYFGNNSENAIEEYKKRIPEVKVLDKEYKAFYRVINGYIETVHLVEEGE